MKRSGSESDVVVVEQPSDYAMPRLRVHGGTRCWTVFSYGVALSCAVLLLTVYSLLSWTRKASYDSAGHLKEHSVHYFYYCFLGGLFSGLSHVAVVPIDNVKCRIQTGEFRSLHEGFFKMFSQEAKSSLWRSVPVFFKGIVPTAIGYCSQGTLKFGFYELFKYYLGAPGRGGAMSVFIFLLSSCLAELLADLALAPWEAVKVKIQTNKQMPTALGAVLQLMWAEEGIQAFYKGLVPLWGRQVPMTMMKFASFEKIVVTLHYLARHRKASNVKNLIITVLAGIFSGVLCTIVSHPGDVLVSRLNQKVVEPQTNLETDRGLLGVIRAIGWRGLWKGLSARIVMICCITASQWFIYDTFKIAVGLSTTGKAKN